MSFVLPPKEDLFQSKQGFQVHNHVSRINREVSSLHVETVVTLTSPDKVNSNTIYIYMYIYNYIYILYSVHSEDLKGLFKKQFVKTNLYSRYYF